MLKNVGKRICTLHRKVKRSLKIFVTTADTLRETVMATEKGGGKAPEICTFILLIKRVTEPSCNVYRKALKKMHSKKGKQAASWQ